MQKTFLVNIMYEQNASWQGSIDWICENDTKSQYFRSAMELIRLIDSTMKKPEEVLE